ncbi:NAD(P)/FAD-dependent oxidoreductase [Rhizobium tumorigenes]|uniref:NADH:ubiquinone reductase (non-electrogenic) n=1 Tax=Rhizobium tumorigenes TaxID=2041385 RepID=A0AAF1KEE2_9HYPH|nr:NAD(P)/FAD-dependent oxidoreductase [Rhizobium tumorigenes]WFR98626.1 NAD(P)/FAD-dependent oxidoreductase [Rhizobium tumorigenes]
MQPTESRLNKASKPHIVIIGAGFGGLAVERGLAGSGAIVTLIDRQNHHVFQPLLYQVATAGLSPADIAAPIRAIVKRHKDTRVLLAEVSGVDADNKRVAFSDGSGLDYDALVIATGARHSYFGRDEWARFAPGIKTLDDATLVRRKILLAMERAETIRQESLPDREEFLNFVVVGGGPTGVEMAGAIAELTRHAAEMDFRFITRTCLRIILVEAGPRLLATFPASLGDAARKALEGLGVVVRLGGRVTDIGDYGVTIGEERILTSSVIWAAGVQASDAAKWLQVDADRSGRVKVTADLSVPGHQDVFVIGDTATLIDASGRPVPGVAPAAKQEGLHVALTLRAQFTGSRLPPAFRYRNWGNLATIGRKRAVAEIGSFRVSGMIAWLLWSTAHIYFLVGFRNRIVVGANWLWSYLTFERGARLITGMTHVKPSPKPSEVNQPVVMTST